MREENVKERKAVELLCDRDLELNIDTVKTYVRKAKAEWKRATTKPASLSEGKVVS
jgi:hypothetical protein